MSEPFLSEIKVVSFNFPPKGWAFCNGQFLPINQNQALFALLGTRYGGNGQTNFSLPNLQGRVPIHAGGTHLLGDAAGASSVTLTTQHLPPHVHEVAGQTEVVTPDANGQDPTGRSFAAAQMQLQGGGTAPVQMYGQPAANPVAMHAEGTTPAGGSQAHGNMMPYLALNFIIALQGIFPSQN